MISELKAEGFEPGALLSSLEYAGDVLAILAARTEYVIFGKSLKLPRQSVVIAVWGVDVKCGFVLDISYTYDNQKSIQ